MPDPRALPDLPRLGIGAGSLANAGGEAAFVATVQAAWERGVRYFDTSALYLGGDSERRLGLALAGVPRRELHITTKLGRFQDHQGSGLDPRSGPGRFDYSAETALRSVERSLALLKVDRLDAVFIHDLEPRLCADRYDALMAQALDGAYPALRRLQEEGTVGAVGIATMNWRACLAFAQRAEVGIMMPAGEYSLLKTDCGPLLEWCERHDIAWIAASPFNSGILATGARPDAIYTMRPATPAALAQTRRIEAVCVRHGVPLPAAALQFPLRHPVVRSVVFGAKAVDELDETLALAARAIPEAFWQEMDALLATTRDWESRGA